MREISIFSLIELAFKHIISIIISAMIFALLAIGYCKYIVKPQYSACGAILVTNGAIISVNDVENIPDEKLQNTDIITSLNFIPTAEQILKEKGIYKELARKIDNKYSYGKLSAMASIKSRGDNSLYIDVIFTASSKGEAVYLVNEFLELVPSYIKNKVSSVAISYDTVDEATKVSLRPATTATVAAFGGIAVAYIIHLFIFLTNTSIDNEDEFKRRFDIPVIGSIPDFSSAKSSKYYNKYYRYYGRDNNKYG